MNEPTPTWPQEVLYILASENNDTGLTAERARELTGAIIQQLRVSILRACFQVMPRNETALFCALDLYRDMTQEPRHEWEPRIPPSFGHLMESNRALHAQLDEKDALIAELRAELARRLGLEGEL